LGGGLVHNLGTGRISQGDSGKMKKSIIAIAKRGLVALGISLWMTLTALVPTQAQNVGGNVETGRALARAWCAECHRTEPGQFGIFAADFGEVANLPSTTALSLRVFLYSNHKEMPNFSIKPADADDIIAYILSLKRQ
jgi:mono/diheme cytochrome c family protein